jgi:predicted transposase YbfD/YdcC
MERFINAVRKQWAADNATVLAMWQSGKTIEQIRAVVPISERTFWEILEAHASREAAGQ